MSIDEESTRERQARVQKVGSDWEEYVRFFLNEKLQGTGIEVIYGKNEGEIKKRSISLWRMLTIPLKATPTERTGWGDIDLVAVKDNLPIAVISCKLSLHGRFTETLFYSLLFKMLTKVKFVLATPDAGRGQSGKWTSEWGTPEAPTKDRILAESYLDGVYVDNVEDFCKNKKPEEHTALGGIVRSLSELSADLIRWGEEVSKFIYSGKNLDAFK
jgi:hypothetical protein